MIPTSLYEESCDKLDLPMGKILDCFENNCTKANKKKILKQLNDLVNRLNPDFDEMNQCEIEKKRLDARIKGFEYKKSRAFNELNKREPFNKLRFKELVSVAQVIETNLNIPLQREEKRRKNHLYQWFERNLDAILHEIDEGHIRLIFDQGENNDQP